MHARINERGIVADIHPDPFSVYPQDLAEQFVLVPEAHRSEVARGWRVIDDIWSAPEPEDPAPVPAARRRTSVSLREFNLLFSFEEMLAISAARELRDGETPQETQVRKALNEFFRILEIETDAPINLAHPMVAQGLSFLATSQILTPERAAEIAAGIEE